MNPLRCPNLARLLPASAVWLVDGTGPSQALLGPYGQRFAIRWTVFRRSDVNRHLLPSDLSGEKAEGSQLPVLRQPATGRTRRFSPLLALPAGAGSRERADRRRSAHRPADRTASGGGTLR